MEKLDSQHTKEAATNKTNALYTWKPALREPWILGKWHGWGWILWRIDQAWFWMCEDQSVFFNADFTASAVFRTVFCKVWGGSSKVMSPILLCWPTTLDLGAGVMAVDVEPFWK
jgi:hypothetical protein